MLLYIFAGLAVFYFFFLAKRPQNAPPGPRLRLPVFEQMHYEVFGNKMEIVSNLRKK